MIFQDPHASLNPRMTVGDIVAEPLVVQPSGPGERTSGSRSCCEQVGLPAEYARRYPARVLAAGSGSGSASRGRLRCEPDLIVRTSRSRRWMFPCRRRF